MSLYCATVLPLFERLWGYFLLHPQTQEFSLNFHSLADEADERLGPLGDLQPQHRLTSYVNSTLYVFVPP